MAIAVLTVGVWTGCQKPQAESSGRTELPVPAESSDQGEGSVEPPDRPAIVKGRLLYFSGRFGAPRLRTISSLLSLYANSELADVTELSLSGNDIGAIEGLGRVPNLKTLSLRDNEIGLISGLEDVPQLEILNLSGNRIERIEGLEGVRRLRELYLERNRIEKIQNLSHLGDLEVLILNWNRIRKLEGLRDLKSLWWLEVGANALEDFSELLHLESVRSLTIAGPDHVIDGEDERVFREWNRLHPEKPLDMKGAPVSASPP